MARPMRRQQPMPLATRGLTGFRVGTVDKFQGRKAPVVIYSMATSSARRGTARPGIPLRPAPAERGDLTGQSNGDHRGQSGPHPGALPDTHQMTLANAMRQALGRARIIPTGVN